MILVTQPTLPTTEPPPPTSRLFRLTAIAGIVFVVTVLALIAIVIGNSQSPGARWLNRNAGSLFAVEVAAILVLGYVAMAQDQQQTRRSRDEAGPSTAKSDE